MSHLAAIEAQACSNIALVKYWGKLERPGNYPAVPSLSLTLSGLRTTTRIELAPQLPSDEVALDGEPVTGRPRTRVVAVLDDFRRRSDVPDPARVSSRNDFPTASGLASSASGFAALVTAANAAYSTKLTRAELSAIARIASASAARSLFGGWSILEVGADSAEPLAPVDHWPLVLLVAITSSEKKALSSTEAMNLTRSTSPYYDAWVTHARAHFEEAKAAVLSRDLPRLGAAMEQSTLMMHATMLAARPSVLYWSVGTLNAMRRVHSLRVANVPCYFTMDAGPHVKVLCSTADAAEVRAALLDVEGVSDVTLTHPGPGAELQPVS